jgi:site-specific recombinase XerD
VKKTHLLSAKSEPEKVLSIPVNLLRQCAEDWLLDGEVQQLTPATYKNRKFITDKFIWFLEREKFEECGEREIKKFFAYVNKGHLEPEGRWGDPRQKEKPAPLTVHTYFNNLSAFFGFIVRDGFLTANPFDGLSVPVERTDQIQPFTEDQVRAMFEAAKRSVSPKRDTAILWFLLDTGARATELCSLKFRAVNFSEQHVVVTGKGDKKRTLPFGRTTRKALWDYVRADPHEDDDPLFIAQRGTLAGEHLTRSGLFQLIRRLGRSAGITRERCAPHTFRHTFAIEYLRNGGDAFSLKELLGHTSLEMTNKYVALAQADIRNKHRRFSPGDNFGKNSNNRER